MTTAQKRPHVQAISEPRAPELSHRFDRRHDEVIRDAIRASKNSSFGPILETGILCLECRNYISVLTSECTGELLSRFKAS